MSEIERHAIPLIVPTASYLADVIRRGLTPNFEEVIVDWVLCPDLTQRPFKLAAQGLCGSPAILQMGGTGNMFPSMREEVVMNFVDIIKLMGRHDQNSFIIGGCLCPHGWRKEHYGELSTNVLSRVRGTKRITSYQGRFTIWLYNECTTMYFPLATENLCSMMGNFYVSEGRPGPVLKVYAKKRIGLEFIDAMQSALSEEFSGDFYNQACVGLGGVFVVNGNGLIRNHVTPKLWDTISNKIDLRTKLHYFDMETPLVGAGMFLSTDSCRVKNKDGNWADEFIWFTKKQFNTFNKWKSGSYERDIGNSDTLEYRGYFHPAYIMHRVMPNVNLDIPDLHGLDMFRDTE